MYFGTFPNLHGNAPINTDIPPKSFLIFTGGYIDNVRVWTSPLIFRVFVSILLGFLTGDIFHSGYYRSCTEWTVRGLLLVIHMYGVDLTVPEANRVSGLMLPVGDYRRSVRVFGGQFWTKFLIRIENGTITLGWWETDPLMYPLPTIRVVRSK